MDTRDIALGYQANFVAVALVCLVNCLKNQGALGARQYTRARCAQLLRPGVPTARDWIINFWRTCLPHWRSRNRVSLPSSTPFTDRRGTSASFRSRWCRPASGTRRSR
jgi:hypothetical protein